MKQVISVEQATLEIENWLDKKKVLPSMRDEYKSQIDILIEGISLGILSLNENGEFSHQLLFPLEEEMPVQSLKYKSRLNDRMLEPHLKGIKASDGDSRVIAYLACLTSQPKGVIKALESADKRIANAIVVFFVG